MRFAKFNAPTSIDGLFSHIASTPYSVFLDSSDAQGFSILAAHPYQLVHTLDGLEQALSEVNPPSIPDELSHLPFLGGAIGFFGYEAYADWETKLRPQKKEPFVFPAICFGLYDTFVVIDHAKRTACVISLELTPKSTELFDMWSGLLKRSSTPQVTRAISKTAQALQSNMTYEEYETRFLKAKQYIEDGEIYQVNLSQCLFQKTTQPPYETYQKLRKLTPANFSAYINTPQGEILSSSPECFLSIQTRDNKHIIRTEPIKGTIKRGETPQEDAALKQSLLKSEKDRAELMMIVDLERNDLGKICRTGTVKVPTLYKLQSFATVHHLVSVIEGELKTTSISEIIKATFPGGSITGAPKLRSMQIIEALEPHNRGVYTGSIGWIDYRGQVDLNIAIRTMVHQNGTVYFPVGGGIVSDSTVREEFNETLHKGRALITAVSTP